MYVEFHEFTKAGHTVEECAELMGVGYSTLRLWLEQKPELQKIMTQAIANRNHDGSVDRVIEFVYNRLPENLQEYWSKLEEFDKQPNAQKAIESLFKDTGKAARQHLFLYALIAHNFNPSVAMRKVNISKTTLDNWSLEPEFCDLIKEINYHKLNFAEGCLTRLMVKGNPQVTMFVNRCLNDKYNPVKKTKDESDNKGATVVTINVNEMSIEAKRELLALKRKQNTPPALEQGQQAVVLPETPEVQ